MKHLRSNIVATVMFAMTVAVVSSLPLTAQADEPSRWNLKGGLVLIDTSDPFAIDKPSGGQVHAGGNAALGAFVGIEYRLSNLIGLELAASYGKSPDVNDSSNANNDEIGGGPGFVPVLAGANFHFKNTGNIDIYAGPRIAFVSFGDFDLDIDGQKTRFEVDDDFAWGATAGIDYRFGDSRWSLIAEVTYLDVDMEISERGSTSTVTTQFDPLIVNLGASFRF